MLVNWTKIGVKVIQVPSTKEMVVLAPGYNQVPDSQWKEARERVICQIGDGTIIEEWLDVEKNSTRHKEAILSVRSDDPKNEATTVRIPATFKDITRKRTDAVIAETFNPKTLKAWYEDESRDDIRVKIFRQLEGVNDGSIKDSPKK